MPSVNKAVLTWARTTAGLSLEEAAAKLGFEDNTKGTGADRLKKYEDGTENPSRPVLKEMAKQYRRPLLAFYMDNVPRVANRGQDFRTLPVDVAVVDEVMIDTLLRSVRSRQAMLKSALEDEEEAEALGFVGMLKVTDSIDNAVNVLENVLRMTRAEYRAEGNVGDAFTTLREHAERSGVYVLLVDNLGSHHTTLNVALFRGFALADGSTPFVVINSNDARSAWSFTLLHEFVHILLGATGISGGTPDKQLEKFCNDVASAFLLPVEEVRGVPLSRGSIDDLAGSIGTYATRWRVSRTLVAYRLLLAGRVTKAEYETLSERFYQQIQAEREREREERKKKAAEAEKPSGPSYFQVKRHRLGQALMQTTSRMIDSGALTLLDGARVLDVAAGKVDQLLKRQPAQEA